LSKGECNGGVGPKKKNMPPATTGDVSGAPASTSPRSKGGFLKRINKKKDGAGGFDSKGVPEPPAPSPTKRITKAKPPSPALLLAQKATTNPGRQRLIDSQQFSLQCMKEAGYTSAGKEKFVFLRRPNLI
jgi:hypothetical protein